MRKSVLALAAAALFLGLVYFMADYDLSTGAGLPLYSSRRYDPYGTSAFRELLEARGVETRSLERPVPAGRAGETLVMVLPTGPYDFEKRRYERLIEWVEKGNRLLILSRDPPLEIRSHIGSPTGDVSGSWGGRGALKDFELQQAAGDYRSPLAEVGDPAIVQTGDGERTLFLLKPTFFKPASSPRLKVLAERGESAVAASLGVGQGSVVFFGDPTPRQNFAVAKEDNAEFLLSLVGHGTVYFDEYALGLGHEDSMMDWLKRAGLVPFLVQGMVVLYLLARSSDTDFATPTPAPVDDAGANAEKQIAILGALYEQTLSDAEIQERRRLYRREKENG